MTSLLAGLEAAGKRRTAQRDAICRAMVEHGGHPTAGEVFALVRDRFPMISQATVYNTMETLRELALVGPVEGSDGQLHYDLDTTPHVNIVCRRCGRIQDVQANEVAPLMSLVGSRSQYHVESEAGITMRGICRDCRRAE